MKSNENINKVKYRSYLSNSIEKLENDKWEAINDYPTSTIEKCYQLRKKSISNLTNEELRLALSQDIGIELIIPIVKAKLEENLLLECDLYPGDLLHQFVQKLGEYWGESEPLKFEVKSLIVSNLDTINNSDKVPKQVKNEISRIFDEYEQTHKNNSL